MNPTLFVEEKDNGYSVISGERPRRTIETDQVRAGVCSKVVNQLAHKGWSTCIVGTEEDECSTCILNKNRLG